MCTLNLGLHLFEKDYDINNITNVDLSTTVGEFKTMIAEKIELPVEKMDLSFAGRVLKDDKILKDCGLKENYVLHVIQKREAEVMAPATKFSDDDIRDLVHVFRILTTRNGQRLILCKMNKPGVLDNIISTTPGLKNDVIAISILRCPELLAKMADTVAVRRVIENHPAIADAARNMVSHLGEKFVSANTRFNSYLPYSTSFTDAISEDDDEDDDDDSQSETPLSGTPHSSSESGNGDGPSTSSSTNSTPSAFRQVSVALSRLASNARNGGPASTITSEMVNHAVEQAMASTSTTPSVVSDVPLASNSYVTPRNLSELRRLGFTNDANNIQALELSNGDIEVAVNILLSGVMDD